MTTAITTRVSGVASASNTPRVAGETSAIYDAWGGSWGASWAQNWLVYASLATLGHTARILSVPGGTITKRITI